MSFSGEVSEEPRNSGLLFENRLIDQQSNEWDSQMLSNFALEKQLHMARQELSNTLHQHDAARHVITRLKKERDEAISLLPKPEKQLPAKSSEKQLSVDSSEKQLPAESSANGNGKRAAEDMNMGPEGKKLRPGISSDIIAEISKCYILLSRQRMKRKIPETSAPRYAKLSTLPLHDTSKPGILSIDIHLSKNLIATGGVDSKAVIFDHSSSKIISNLTGHSKEVTSVKIMPQDDPFVITGSEDKTVRLWKGSEDGNYECKHILKDHKKAVQAVTIHPSNKYLATISRDKTWCFYDLSTALCITQVTDPSKSNWTYLTAAFHPDGLLLGAGTSKSTVRLWDVKSQTVVAKLNRHNGPVTSISFSENGYFLAIAAEGGVKLWDLRKRRSFQCFPCCAPSVTINSVNFDHSGTYLAVADAITRIYEAPIVKTDWKCIKGLPDLSATGKLTSVRFGPEAKYTAVGSMDHNLRIFSLPTTVVESPKES